MGFMNGSSFSIYICKVIYVSSIKSRKKNVSSIASGMHFFQIADGKVPFQDFFPSVAFCMAKL
jgi:hypothetical protein